MASKKKLRREIKKLKKQNKRLAEQRQAAMDCSTSYLTGFSDIITIMSSRVSPGFVIDMSNDYEASPIEQIGWAYRNALDEEQGRSQ